jgi:FkbM family methyltransferase
MRLVEKLSTNLRHSQYLKNYDSLWNFVRPLYNRFIEQYGKNGLERRINGTDKISVLPKFRGVAETYEPDVWDDIMSNIKAGDCVVDVGAYIGLYAIAIAKRLESEGKIIAFEPDPLNFQDIKQHIRLNQVDLLVEPINLAVGEKESIVYFESGRDSQSSIQESSSSKTIAVNCVSLDNYFKNEKLDILKIDVEGYEEKVLKGATNLLHDHERSPRRIYIEVHPFAWEKVGTSWDSLLDFLGDCHYDVFTLDGTPAKQITWWGEIIASKQSNNKSDR